VPRSIEIARVDGGLAACSSAHPIGEEKKLGRQGPPSNLEESPQENATTTQS
jgi:hypothetical protein